MSVTFGILVTEWSTWTLKSLSDC